MMWTYTIHTEANFSYPYDIPAVAFFSAGLYFIYSRKYLPLLAVVLLGTFNRETTLFLIGIYVIDATASPLGKLRQRLSFGSAPWLRTILLCIIWLTIKVSMSHAFVHNNNAENHIRLRENLASLKPRLWPALLNVCGYMLPVVLLLNRFIRNQRFRSYLWILPVWFGVMFYTGVIVETRIYGELCPYIAVAVVIIMEGRLASAADQVDVPESNPIIQLNRAD